MFIEKGPNKGAADDQPSETRTLLRRASGPAWLRICQAAEGFLSLIAAKLAQKSSAPAAD